jgi:hypothetical protein
LCSGLIAALAGCCAGGDPHAPFYLSPTDVRSAIVTDRIKLGLLDKARKGDPSTTLVDFDLATRKCREHDETLRVFLLHDRRTSYIPEEQYDEVAFICPKDHCWFYQYLSPDRKITAIYGPYWVVRQPTGGGPGYERGGPAIHRD